MVKSCNISHYAEMGRTLIEKIAKYAKYDFPTQDLQGKQNSNIYYWNKILNSKRGVKWRQKWDKFHKDLAKNKKLSRDMSISYLPPVLDVVSSLDNSVIMEINCAGKKIYVNCLEVLKQILVITCKKKRQTKTKKKHQSSEIPNPVVIFNPITQYPFTDNEITMMIKKLKMINRNLLTKIVESSMSFIKPFLGFFGVDSIKTFIDYYQDAKNANLYNFIYRKYEKINTRDLYSLMGKISTLTSKLDPIIKGYFAFKYFLTKEKNEEYFSLTLAKQIYLTQLARTLVIKYSYKDDIDKLLKKNC